MLSTTTARLGIAAAAVVVALGVGAVLLNGNGGRAGLGAAPSPVASSGAGATFPPLDVAPTAPCGASGVPDCLAPGTYAVTTLPGQMRVTVPKGWFEWHPGSGTAGLLVDSGADAPSGSGWGVLFLTVGTVFRDPCDSSLDRPFFPADVDTPGKLAYAMRTWPGFKASAPQAISIGGVDGLLVELTSTRSVAECPSGVLWQTPMGTNVDTYGLFDARGERHALQFRIIEVDGQLLVIRTTDFPETSPFERDQGVAVDPKRHVADQAELHAILDSIRLGG